MRIRGTSVLIAVAALAFGAMSFAQSEPKTVTYSTVAKTADKVIAELAELTGEQLEVTKDAVRHVLALHVEDVELDDLLDRIATVTSSKWAKESNGRRTLQPDQPLRRRLAREAQQEKVASVRESLADLQKQLQGTRGDEYGAGRLPGFSMYSSMSTPGSKALARLMVLLPPADVASLEDGQRIVYSTLPNSVQRPFGGGTVNAVLNDLVAEHNAWFRETAEERMQERLQMQDQLSEMGIAAEFFANMMSREEPKLIDGTLNEALIAVEQGGGGFFGGMFASSGDTSVTLTLLDVNGKVLLTEQMELDSYFPRFAEMNEIARRAGVENIDEEEELEEEEQLDESDTALIEFREISRQIAQTGQYYFDETPPEIAPEILKIALSPFQYDPLSFAESDCLISIAKAKGWNVVANLPDEVDISWLVSDDEQVTVQTVLMYLDGDSAIDTLLDGDWFSIMPAQPVESLNERVDRAAVQTYVTRVREKGYASLDDLAYLASRMTEEASQSNAASAIELIGHPTEMDMMTGGGTWETLRFWGLLSSGVKQSLVRGNTLNFNQLGTAARNQLSVMAYGTGANLMSREQLEKERSVTIMERIFSMGMMGVPTSSYLSEPTEVMPDGLPAMGTISINVTTGGLAVMEKRGSGEMAFFTSVGAEEIAFYLVMKEAADKAGEDIGIPEVGTFKIGKRNKLEIVFNLSQNAVMTRSLNDDSIEPGAVVSRLSNLPPEFAAEVNALKALFAESPFASMMMSMMEFGVDEIVEPPE